MTQRHVERTHSMTAVTDGAVEEQRQLLQRLEQGDGTAFWELWQDFEDDVCFRQCYRLMRGHREDAEDALSSGRLKAYQQLPLHAATIEQVNSWLSRLLSNHCIDIRRARERHDRMVCCVGDVDLLGEKVLSSAHESAENVVLRREALLYMCQAIDNLPVRLREPSRLRFFHEMSHRDIAVSLHLSHDNVRKRLQQARALLREQITAYLVGCSPGVWKPVVAPQHPAEEQSEPDDLHTTCDTILMLDDTSGMDQPIVPGHATTTLYDLIVALHEMFTAEEDALVVATVMHWIDTGWLKLPSSVSMLWQGDRPV
jgi:RNA polymerase sigma-70 factor (ECF subfamily)